MSCRKEDLPTITYCSTITVDKELIILVKATTVKMVKLIVPMI